MIPVTRNNIIIRKPHMGTSGKERIKEYRQRKKKKTGGKNLSVFISGKTAEHIETIKKNNGDSTNLVSYLGKACFVDTFIYL